MKKTWGTDLLKVIFTYLIFAFSINANAEQFWNSDLMVGEQVMFQSFSGEAPNSTLIATPSKILRVTDSTRTIEYVEGVDYYISGRSIILMPGSSMYSCNTYASTGGPDYWPRQGGGTIYFAEGAWFHQHQYVVDYQHNGLEWLGNGNFEPQFYGHKLPHALNLLNSSAPINVTFLGDSITVGANASGFVGAAPFLPTWAEKVSQNLQEFYGSTVTYNNLAVGGTKSEWGVTQMGALLGTAPDLVILGFGMNDAASNSVAAYKANMNSMISTIRTNSPHTDIILVASMLPNVEAVGTSRVNLMYGYRDALNELAAAYSHKIAVADVTSMWAGLLNLKRYQDITGNNVNHPNDTGMRVYSQTVSSALIPYEKNFIAEPVFVNNYSFETPALGSANFQYNPTGSSWVFSNTGIGANNSPINITNSPVGVQAAFLQGNSSIEQVINFNKSGTHRFRFYSAQRPGNTQRVALLLDGINILEAQPGSSNWELFEVHFGVTAGSHTLRFEGLNPLNGDHTAFIDWVEVDRITPYPTIDPSADIDGDGFPSYRDADDDGDGSLDRFEIVNGRNSVDVTDLEFAFDDMDAENWQAINHISSLSVTGAGELQLQVAADSNDPFMIKNDLNFSGDIIRNLYIRYRSDSVVSAGWPQLYWATATNNTFSGSRVMNPTSQTPDGVWTVASYDLFAHAEWAGNMISQLRIDINGTITAAESTWIDVITATNIVPDRYASWKATYGVVEDDEDPDGDGISNFLEFALGGDPHASDAHDILPTVARNANAIEFRFNRAEPILTYTVQTSPDLFVWINFTGAPITVTQSFETYSIQNNGRVFVRLVVSD